LDGSGSGPFVDSNPSTIGVNCEYPVIEKNMANNKKVIFFINENLVD
jgi:hypothetical protein